MEVREELNKFGKFYFTFVVRVQLKGSTDKQKMFMPGSLRESGDVILGMRLSHVCFENTKKAPLKTFFMLVNSQHPLYPFQKRGQDSWCHQAFLLHCPLTRQQLSQ